MPDAALIPEQQPFGDLASLLPMLQQLFGQNTSSNTTEESPMAVGAASQLLPMLMSMFSSGDFSQEAAIRDSEGGVASIIRSMTEGGLPIISQQENYGGGYGSTTAGLLRNDLAVRTAESAAARRDATKVAYQGQRNSQSAIMIQLINAMTNAQRLKATQNNVQGLAQNRNAQAAALAALIAGMAKKPASNSSGSKPDKGGGGSGRNSAKAPPEVNKEGVPSDKPYSPFEENYPEQSSTTVPTTDPYEVDQAGMGVEDPFNVQGELGGGMPGDFNLDFMTPYTMDSLPDMVDFSQFDFGNSDAGGGGDSSDFGDLGDFFDFGNLGDMGGDTGGGGDDTYEGGGGGGGWGGSDTEGD